MRSLCACTLKNIDSVDLVQRFLVLRMHYFTNFYSLRHFVLSIIDAQFSCFIEVKRGIIVPSDKNRLKGSVDGGSNMVI